MIPTIQLGEYKEKYLAQCLVKHGFVCVDNWQSLVDNSDSSQTFDDKLQKSVEADDKYGDRNIERAFQSLSDTLIAMICKSFGLKYSTLDGTLGDHVGNLSKQNSNIQNWSAVTLIYTNAISVKIRSQTSSLELPVGWKLILSCGKILELISGGLVFNNILTVDGDSIAFARSLDLSLTIEYLTRKYNSLFETLKSNYQPELEERMWNVNSTKNPSMGEFNSRKRFNGANSNVITGKEHSFGYLQNYSSFFNAGTYPLLNYVILDIDVDQYLVTFELTKSVGDLWNSEISSKILKRKDEAIEKGFENFHIFNNQESISKLGFLERVFSNFDNIIYTYFLNHTNLPSLQEQFLPILSKTLGARVTVTDILKIKLLYPQSYEIYRADPKILITLSQDQLKVSNFAMEMTQRKAKFAQVIKEVVESGDFEIEPKVKELFNNLKSVPVSQKPTIIKKINKSAVSKPQVPANGKLSLLERIKLKEAQKKKDSQISGKGDSNGDLIMIFEILYTLNDSNTFKTLPSKAAIVRICDSLKATRQVSMSTENIESVIKRLNEKLPDEIFTVVNFGKREILKFNFYNQREQVLQILRR